MKNILITGVAGYIGSVLARKLLENDFEVIGIDNLSFGGESLLSLLENKNFRFIKADIRDVDSFREVLKETDAVIHLAAIVGDPACSKDSALAEDVNFNGSKMLFDNCLELTNIKRFVFASTCSNYGKMQGVDFLTEESDLNPVSLYAELKVRFEKYILSKDKRDDLSVTCLRFATAYGLSARMRFDLTVNEFVKDVVLNKRLVIYGEQFWRPYCHIEDIATACILVLKSDSCYIDKQVFGVGDTEENYQKKMLAEILQQIDNECKVEYVKKEEDPRDYRVDFSKIKHILNFSITKKVPESMKLLYKTINDGIISNIDDERYKNS